MRVSLDNVPLATQSAMLQNILLAFEGETFSKDIDVCTSFDMARYTYEAAMEYGYNNPKFPNVSLVSCVITDMGGAVMEPYNETWRIPDPEPEPPEPEQAAE